MATFTDWVNGNVRDLGVGWYYKQRFRSVSIPEGQVVTFYEREDRTGWKSRPFYQGDYSDLTFYGVPEYPGVIHVEETGLRSQDFVRVINGIPWTHTDGKTYYYQKFNMIPAGERQAPNDFENDAIDAVDIPLGLTVELFRDSGFAGGSLIFSGTNKQGYSRVNLNDYSFQDTVSSMRITSDEWELAGVALENETIVSKEGETIGATIEIANNARDGFAGSVTKNISCSYTETTEENWNIGGSVTAKAGFEAGAMGIKVSGELSVTVSGGYGQSKSESRQVQLSDSVTINADKRGKAKASLIVEYGEMEADAVRKWRNKVTGVILEERGHIKFNRANKTRVEIH